MTWLLVSFAAGGLYTLAVGYFAFKLGRQSKWEESNMVPPQPVSFFPPSAPSQDADLDKDERVRLTDD